MNKYETGREVSTVNQKRRCGQRPHRCPCPLEGVACPLEVVMPPGPFCLRSPQPRSASSAAAPGSTEANAAASAKRYGSGNQRSAASSFNEATSNKAMASRAASMVAVSMLEVFVGGQCTASNSFSALETCIRVSMRQSAFMSLPWCVLACSRESFATNDKRREPAPGAVAWVAIGDSCDRSGGFFCVPSVRAARCWT